MLRALAVVLLSCSLRAVARPAESAPAPKRESQTDRIMAAIESVRVEKSGSLRTLYGLPINGSDTDKGRLACARVVAAVLRQAGVPLSEKTASVAQVEDALSRWHRVSSEEDIRAGDVVIYRHMLSPSRVCTGGGTCHVVISMGGSRVFGNSSYDIPLFTKQGPQKHDRVWLTLAGYRFKVAYRAP
jgi:hypothetical protein